MDMHAFSAYAESSYASRITHHASRITLGQSVSRRGINSEGAKVRRLARLGYRSNPLGSDSGLFAKRLVHPLKKRSADLGGSRRGNGNFGCCYTEMPCFLTAFFKWSRAVLKSLAFMSCSNSGQASGVNADRKLPRLAFRQSFAPGS